MLAQQSLTVERVLEETLVDVRSYYHGRALRELLTYAPGDIGKINEAAGHIRKLLEFEQQMQPGRSTVPSPVTAIK